jgi:hypothetical protein
VANSRCGPHPEHARTRPALGLGARPSGPFRFFSILLYFSRFFGKSIPHDSSGEIKPKEKVAGKLSVDYGGRICRLLMSILRDQELDFCCVLIYRIMVL